MSASLDELRSRDAVVVFKDAAPIGTLERTTNGARFTYRENVTAGEGIAYSMPPSRRVYEVTGTNLHPFFAGLLPEGLRLTALVRVVKTSADDLFTLLLASSSDAIGDIWVARTEEQEASPRVEVADLAEVNFNELFYRSIESADPTTRARDLTIAGVQPKVSAAMISFPVTIKKRAVQAILKLNPEGLPQLIENEHFFMALARDCGLSVAKTTLVRDRSGVPGLLVDRFDRAKPPGASRMLRVHQEDACQLLERYPADKYRLRVSDIAEAIERFASAPVVELSKFLRLQAFSYLIGNGDLHGKNVSLHTDPVSRRIVLTPAYDLLSTYPYGDRKMALELEGRTDNLKRRDLVAFGERWRVPRKVTEQMLDELVPCVASSIARLEAIGFGKKEHNALVKLMKKRGGELGA